MSFDDQRLSASNWRPTRSSTVAATLLAWAATLGLAAVAGSIAPAALGFLAGLCLTGTVWATSRTERRVATILAGILAVIGGLASVGGVAVAVVMQVGWPPTPPLPFLEFAPFALFVAGSLAGFGGTATVWGVSGGDAGTAGGRVIVTALVPVAALFLDVFSPLFEPLFAVVEFGLDILFVRGVAVPTGQPTIHLVVSLLLAAVAAVAVRVALGSLPLVELASEDAESEIEAAVGGSRRLLGWLAALLGLSALAVAVVVQLPGGLYPRVPPLARSLLAWLGISTALRWLFVVCVVGSVASAVGVRLLRSAASERLRPDFIPGVSLAVGSLFVAVVWAVHPTVRTEALTAASSETGRRLLLNVFETFGSFAVTLGVVCFGLALAVLPLLAVQAAGELRLLGETTGPQLAATGTLTAAIAAAIADLSVVFVVVGVAVALLVWDLGEFAATLGDEMGRRGSTRRGEFVHAAGGVLLAGVASVVAVIVSEAVGLVPETPTVTAVAAAVAAVVGTILLFILAR